MEDEAPRKNKSEDKRKLEEALFVEVGCLSNNTMVSAFVDANKHTANEIRKYFALNNEPERADFNAAIVLLQEERDLGTHV